MSANNQVIILKNKEFKLKQFEVHEHFSVDNFFEPNRKTLLKRFKTLIKAIKYANEYCRENMVEYGVYVGDSCLEEEE